MGGTSWLGEGNLPTREMGRTHEEVHFPWIAVFSVAVTFCPWGFMGHGCDVA